MHHYKYTSKLKSKLQIQKKLKLCNYKDTRNELVQLQKHNIWNGSSQKKEIWNFTIINTQDLNISRFFLYNFYEHYVFYNCWMISNNFKVFNSPMLTH